MDDRQRLILCFALSLVFIVAAAWGSFFLRKTAYAKHGDMLYKGKSMLSPFHVLLIGFFLGICCLFYPMYYADWDGGGNGFLRALSATLASLRNGAQVFIMEGDASAVKETIFVTLTEGSRLGVAFYVYTLTLFIVAPVFTATFVLSFFKNVSASLRYHISSAKKIYYISKLTEKSIELAKNIAKQNERRNLIVFFDVLSGDEEEESDLLDQARRLGGICFKKNVTEIGLLRGRKKAIRKFYFIGENESENVKQALTLINICRGDKRLNTKQNEFYVFATTRSSETLLDTVVNGNLKVRRVNETKNLIWHILSQGKLFENCIEEEGVKKINLLIVGLGRYGIELLKAACWCCQMIGYYLTVHVVDQEENCRQTLEAIVPELLEYSDCAEVGEAKYSLRIHSGVNVLDSSFSKKLREIGQISVAVTTLGEDELNMETAMMMSEVFRSQELSNGWARPYIYTVVYSSIKSETMHSNGLRSIKGDDYKINLIGSISSRYSLAVIEQIAMEQAAVECHTKWSETEASILADVASFNKFEYYRNSSRAEAIYAQIRKNLGIALNENGVTLTQITEYEHMRWNAYMRSEGFVYGKKKDYIAKTHPDLVSYWELSPEERKKSEEIVLKSLCKEVIK